MKGDREKCLQKGMDEYISKPIDMNGLLELITHVMKPTEALQSRAGGHFHAVQ
jgi:CheY-like chemotaxis protein